MIPHTISHYEYLSSRFPPFLNENKYNFYCFDFNDVGLLIGTYLPIKILMTIAFQFTEIIEGVKQKDGRSKSHHSRQSHVPFLPFWYGALKRPFQIVEL